MTHDSHIRLGLVAVLVASASASAYTARADAPRNYVTQAASPGATTHAVPRGVGTHELPAPLQPLVLAALQDSIVSLALAQLGMPYVLGGVTPRRGFDCSGLVLWVTSQVHMSIPRTAKLQALAGAPVRPDALQPGDLLAFGEGRRVSHVGIYVGGGKFVHASSVAGRVVVSLLDRPPSRLIRPMRGARRLLAATDLLSGS